MITKQKQTVLAAASVYNEKYFIDPAFSAIPKPVRDELQFLAISMAKELHCIFSIGFKANGAVYFETQAGEHDTLHQEQLAAQKVDKLIHERAELIQSLTLWYKLFVLKEIP